MRRSNAILEFLKSTIIGGLLVVLPIAFVLVVVVHVVDTLRRALTPITEHLSSYRHFPMLVAIALLLLACMVTGLMARMRAGRGAGGFMERTVLNRIPGYTLLRGFTQQFGPGEHGDTFAPALVEIEDALMPAFIVEVHPDGQSTVFVPASPTPGVGSIYIMANERVHRLDASLIQTVKCISRWGVGSAELLKSMHKTSERAPV